MRVEIEYQDQFGSWKHFLCLVSSDRERYVFLCLVAWPYGYVLLEIHSFFSPVL